MNYLQQDELPARTTMNYLQDELPARTTMNCLQDELPARTYMLIDDIPIHEIH